MAKPRHSLYSETNVHLTSQAHALLDNFPLEAVLTLAFEYRQRIATENRPRVHANKAAFFTSAAQPAKTTPTEEQVQAAVLALFDRHLAILEQQVTPATIHRRSQPVKQAAGESSNSSSSYQTDSDYDRDDSADTRGHQTPDHSTGREFSSGASSAASLNSSPPPTSTVTVSSEHQQHYTNINHATNQLIVRMLGSSHKTSKQGFRWQVVTGMLVISSALAVELYYEPSKKDTNDKVFGEILAFCGMASNLGPNMFGALGFVHYLRLRLEKSGLDKVLLDDLLFMPHAERLAEKKTRLKKAIAIDGISTLAGLYSAIPFLEVSIESHNTHGQKINMLGVFWSANILIAMTILHALGVRMLSESTTKAYKTFPYWNPNYFHKKRIDAVQTAISDRLQHALEKLLACSHDERKEQLRYYDQDIQLLIEGVAVTQIDALIVLLEDTEFFNSAYLAGLIKTALVTHISDYVMQRFHNDDLIATINPTVINFSLLFRRIDANRFNSLTSETSRSIITECQTAFENIITQVLAEYDALAQNLFQELIEFGKPETNQASVIEHQPAIPTSTQQRAPLNELTPLVHHRQVATQQPQTDTPRSSRSAYWDWFGKWNGVIKMTGGLASLGGLAAYDVQAYLFFKSLIPSKHRGEGALDISFTILSAISLGYIVWYVGGNAVLKIKQLATSIYNDGFIPTLQKNVAFRLYPKATAALIFVALAATFLSYGTNQLVVKEEFKGDSRTVLTVLAILSCYIFNGDTLIKNVVINIISAWAKFVSGDVEANELINRYQKLAKFGEKFSQLPIHQTLVMLKKMPTEQLKEILNNEAHFTEDEAQQFCNAIIASDAPLTPEQIPWFEEPTQYSCAINNGSSV